MMLLCTRFSVGRKAIVLSSAGLFNGRKARTSLQGSKLERMLLLLSAGSPLERNKVLLSAHAGYYIRREGSHCFSL
jgi:hypothetical protein